MADKIILADTSILIDFFRKTDKLKSQLVSLIKQGYTFCICVITEYEIYSGASANQLDYWQQLLDKIDVIARDRNSIKVAVNINSILKLKRKQIALADLFISAIAIANKLPLATLNKKHFNRVDGLSLIELI